MHAHEPMVATPAYERAVLRNALGHLLLGIAALVIALSILLAVLWLMLASTTATPFDADGVRCYGKALQLSCLKTANP